MFPDVTGLELNLVQGVLKDIIDEATCFIVIAQEKKE